MATLTDETIMPFGKYQGKKLGDVPDYYLLWLHTEGTKNVLLKEYLDENIEAIKANIKSKKK